MAVYLIICEGETDCWTLWNAGYPALGLPGASNVKCLQLAHVAGFERLIIVSEPDAAGAKFPAVIADHLRDLGHVGRVDVLFMGTSGFKDPAALWVDDPASFRERFDALLAATEHAQESPLTVAGPYCIKHGGTHFFKENKGGHTDVAVTTELANFHARIIEDTMRDDGVGQDRMLTIKAVVDSKPPQTFEIPAAQFAKLEWVAKLRGGAVICAGSGVRDRLREAIERLSGRANERLLYTHTGWREIAGEWVYMHGGGAIGEDGVKKDIKAELPPSLVDFRLPDPPEGVELREMLRASASMLDVGDHAITLPLFAAIWRAAVGEIDFAMFLVGETGSKKSSLAAVVQRHFGANFDRERLPASWASTENFLENLAFRAKDTIMVIDDFRPATHNFDKDMQKKAERIFRAVGNRSGRGRMNADGSEQATKAPRGMILTTAEEFVWGSSLEARMVVLEVTRDALSLEKLKAMHELGAAGVLSAAMAGWVRWLAPRLPEVRRRIARRAADIAGEMTETHARVALALGELRATLEIWEEFSGIKLQSLEGTFAGKAAAQGVDREEQSSTAKFVDLLMSALSNGRAHVRTVNRVKPTGEAALGWTLNAAGQFIAQGITVLYVDEAVGEWYLDTNSAYLVVSGMSNDGNRPNVSVRMLRRLLNEHGYLSRTELSLSRGTYEIRKMIDGVTFRWLAIQPIKFSLPTNPN